MQGVLGQYYEVMRLPRTFRLLLSLLFLAPGPIALAGPDSHRGLESGRAHEVVAVTVPTEGLEVGMPRDGWYARGIELDRKGDWRASAEAYRKAATAFSKMKRSRPGWEKVVKGWVLRAKFQKDQSRRLTRYVGLSTRNVFSRGRYNVALETPRASQAATMPTSRPRSSVAVTSRSRRSRAGESRGSSRAILGRR